MAFALVEFSPARHYARLWKISVKASGKELSRGGTISFDRGLVDCTIRNLSDTGALLEVANPIGIPDRFILIIKPETIRRSCEVQWLSERTIDVKFV
jgi:hypothetical protein